MHKILNSPLSIGLNIKTECTCIYFYIQQEFCEALKTDYKTFRNYLKVSNKVGRWPDSTDFILQQNDMFTKFFFSFFSRIFSWKPNHDKGVVSKKGDNSFYNYHHHPPPIHTHSLLDAILRNWKRSRLYPDKILCLAVKDRIVWKVGGSCALCYCALKELIALCCKMCDSAQGAVVFDAKIVCSV